MHQPAGCVLHLQPDRLVVQHGAALRGEAPGHERVPPELKDAVTLAYHERAHLEQLLTKLKAKNLCKGLGCECKL